MTQHSCQNSVVTFFRFLFGLFVPFCCRVSTSLLMCSLILLSRLFPHAPRGIHSSILASIFTSLLTFLRPKANVNIQINANCNALVQFEPSIEIPSRASEWHQIDAHVHSGSGLRHQRAAGEHTNTVKRQILANSDEYRCASPSVALWLVHLSPLASAGEN